MSSIVSFTTKEDLISRYTLTYVENEEKKSLRCFNKLTKIEGKINVPFVGKREGNLRAVIKKTYKREFKGALTFEQESLFPKVKEYMKKNGCCFLNFYCGAGKTVFSIYIASLLPPTSKILIQCTRLIVINQWVYCINKHIPSAKVHIIKSKDTLEKLKEFDFLILNPTLIRKDNINKYYDMFSKMRIKLLILDEFHLLNTQKKIDAIMCVRPTYLIGLSATPFHDDERDKLFELFFNKNIITLKLYRPFNVYVKKTSFNITNPKKIWLNGKLRPNWNDVLSKQTMDKERNSLITSIIRSFSFRNILVLCKRIEQTTELYDQLKKIGEDVDTYSGTDKTYERNCRVLVSTYSKTGVGFDSDRLDCLLLASDVVSGIEQYQGRIFARSKITPIIIDFEDTFYGFKNHLRERIECYKKCGGEIKKFEAYFSL
jgi:superfamily II DNA or RNA helicase